MKRFLALFLILTMCLSLSSCDSVQVTEPEMVTFTIPVGLVSEGESDPLKDVLSNLEIEYDKPVQNEDGSVSYQLTESQHASIMEAVKPAMESSLNALVDEDAVSVSAISLSDDYQKISIYVDADTYDESLGGIITNGLNGITAYMTCAYGQILYGNDSEHFSFTISVMDEKTSEVLYSHTYVEESEGADEHDDAETADKEAVIYPLNCDTSDINPITDLSKAINAGDIILFSGTVYEIFVASVNEVDVPVLSLDVGIGVVYIWNMYNIFSSVSSYGYIKDLLDSDGSDYISFPEVGDAIQVYAIYSGAVDSEGGSIFLYSANETLAESISAGEIVFGAGSTDANAASYEVTYQNYYLYTDSFGDVRDYIIVEVENTGTVDLYLKSASFEFEDESGHLVAVDSGLVSADPSIIAPGERGYFYSNMGSLSGDSIDINGEYVLIPNLVIEESKNDIIRYEISDTSISSGDLAPINIIGRITNNTDEDESMVWVAVILFDENGTPLGAAGTNVMDLSAGSTQSFDLDAVYLSSLNISVDDVAWYEVYACKTQYQF